jgi:hypothetical protein
VRIGEVSALELDENTGQVRVHIQVEKKFLPRKGDEPTISRGLLNGDTAIDFVPKLNVPVEERTALVAPDSEIPGVPPINAGVIKPGSGCAAERARVPGSDRVFISSFRASGTKVRKDP